MLRNFGIRSKLLALVAVPMTLLLLLSAFVVVQARNEAVKADRVRDLTSASVLLNRVVHALQAERTATTAYLADQQNDSKDRMAKARKPVTVALGELRTSIESLDLSASNALRTGVAEASKQHDGLPALRAKVDDGSAYTADVLFFYNTTIATDLGMTEAVADLAGDDDVARAIRAYAALSGAIENANLERDLLTTSFAHKAIDGETYRQYTGLVSTQESQLQAFDSLASMPQRQELGRVLVTTDSVVFEDQRTKAFDLLTGKGNGDAAAWTKAANARITPLVGLEAKVVEHVRDLASDAASADRQRAIAVTLFALLGLALALALVVWMARLMVRPLRQLTDAAGEVGDELPHMVERMQTPGDGPGVELKPIPVDSKDEIGQLATAFNTVNAVTVQVAREQAALRGSIAEMFVNVARRNQVLLSRQLAFIDQLETSEEDPDALENLFRLDHLATRMRRNAESLLVLAGLDASRKLRTSMPLHDVVRTAASEIEAFSRVDLAGSIDPPVVGRSALSAAHLLAELLENATHFSNPETRVVVATALGSSGVEVTITDHGLGMSDEELAEANDRIANPPLAQIAVAQRLGFYVVGRLAARLGATVSLRRGATGGTVAEVMLPSSLFAEGSLPELETAPAEIESVEEAAPAPEQSAPARELALVGARADADQGAEASPGPAGRAAEPISDPDNNRPMSEFASLWRRYRADRPASNAATTPEPAAYQLVPALDILPGKPIGRSRTAATPVAATPKREEPVHRQPKVGMPERSAAPQRQGAGGPPIFPGVRTPEPDPHGGARMEDVAGNAFLASAALTELSRFTSATYRPDVAHEGRTASGLARRTPGSHRVEAEPTQPSAAPRERSAEEVRGRLAGFRAGVQRGRGAEAPDVSRDSKDGNADNRPEDVKQ